MFVYDFLQMVKGIIGEGINHACLGDDVPAFMEEETFDWAMSLEHTSSFDTIFEDKGEHLLVDLEGKTSNWVRKL